MQEIALLISTHVLVWKLGGREAERPVAGIPGHPGNPACKARQRTRFAFQTYLNALPRASSVCSDATQPGLRCEFREDRCSQIQETLSLGGSVSLLSSVITFFSGVVDDAVTHC